MAQWLLRGTVATKKRRQYAEKLKGHLEILTPARSVAGGGSLKSSIESIPSRNYADRSAQLGVRAVGEIEAGSTVCNLPYFRIPFGTEIKISIPASQGDESRGLKPFAYV